MKCKQVLLVEDDQDLTAIVSYNLEKAGFAVRSFSNGYQAYEWLKQNSPDVIVLDLMLPGINGFELLDQASSRLGSIPVIITTALQEDEIKRRGYQMGAAMVFRKPLSPTRLVKHVIAALAGMRVPADLAA